jgi:NAD(P)-dependent dehydrogenase (short-subunit alcohol dehydrogenase family)
MGTEQKVVVITGASQGFGAGLVKAYRDRNYRVVANSRSIKPSSDPDVLTVAGDVADPTTSDRIVQEALARFGRIDTLINNAGILSRSRSLTIRRKTTPQSLRSMSEASFGSPNASPPKC